MLSAPNYSAGAKLLHHLALSSNFLGETLIDLELSLHGRHLQENHNQAHVFVAGLARAGTTLLMRLLYESGKFCSLTYRDMPFVLAPNLWQKLSGGTQKSMDAQERAHGDGMLVDYDSPEALEEVFWRVTCGKNYISDSELIPMQVDSDELEKFRQYISLVLHRYQGNRYLSKNNNNILRLPSIARAFPNATILVPFRQPLQHANSLLNQHEQFCQQQQDDKFVKRYMTWLSHHEFGLDHRPFNFDKNGEFKSGRSNGLEYWVARWIDAYEYILAQVDNGELDCVFFGYEQFCDNPQIVARNLMDIVGVEKFDSSQLLLKKSVSPEISISNGVLMQRADDIYNELVNLSKSKFHS